MVSPPPGLAESADGAQELAVGVCTQASGSSSMEDGFGDNGGRQSSVDREESLPRVSAERKETGGLRVLRPVAACFALH